MYNSCSKNVYNLSINLVKSSAQIYTAPNKIFFTIINLFINLFFNRLNHKFSTYNTHTKSIFLICNIDNLVELSTKPITTTNL
jgi:hypothetical protein